MAGFQLSTDVFTRGVRRHIPAYFRHIFEQSHFSDFAIAAPPNRAMPKVMKAFPLSATGSCWDVQWVS
jgi:hypothetical protein